MTSDVSELIGSLYAAALEPGAWEAIVQTMVNHLGATSGHIYVHDATVGSAYGVAAQNVDPEQIARFNEAPPCFAALRSADVGRISIQNVRTDVMYNEFLRPMGVRHVLAAKPTAWRRPWSQPVTASVCRQAGGSARRAPRTAAHWAKPSLERSARSRG